MRSSASRSPPSQAARLAAGPLAGAGIVVGSALATVETNALYAARIRERGARAAAPRVFPYTSPNAVAGECSIAFGLTGPTFAVGGGGLAGLEALAAATLLVEGGDADRVVVVAVDEAGPTTRALAGDAVVSGAVALVLSTSPTDAFARVGRWRLRRAPGLAAHVSVEAAAGTARSLPARRDAPALPCLRRAAGRAGRRDPRTGLTLRHRPPRGPPRGMTS